MRKFLLLVLLVALVVAPTLAQDEGPPAMGLRPDAPPYALHGPYWVGTMEFVVNEDSERPLPMTVWYPALNEEGLEESTEYPFQPKLDFELPGFEGRVLGHALADAQPDTTAQPYPLIVFSHGFGGNRQSNAYLTEHLASYGFVVMAPEHIEIWDPALSNIGTSSVERPLDIQAAIALAETLAEPDGQLAGLLDMDNMSIVGYSQGGYTALALGGGLLDLTAFNERCDASSPESAFVNIFCNNILPIQDDLASMAGLDAIPDGPWPSWGDPRVKAVVSLAGAPVLQEVGLSEVSAPVLVLVGTNDTGSEGAMHSEHIYEWVGSDHKAFATFAGADHNIFNWKCADAPGLIEVGFFGVCADPVWDMDRAHDLINHFTTAFLLAELYGDEDARAALAPDAVAFPGIGYEAVGY